MAHGRALIPIHDESASSYEGSVGCDGTPPQLTRSLEGNSKFLQCKHSFYFFAWQPRYVYVQSGSRARIPLAGRGDGDLIRLPMLSKKRFADGLTNRRAER